jgi:periplasmic protein TonB
VAGSPAAIVFGGAPPSWLHVVLSSSGATLALYGLVGVGLARAGHWLQPPVRVLEPTLQVELLEPPPAPPPPEPEPAPPEPPPVAKAAPPRVLEKAPTVAPPPESPSNDSPPPPAEAGEVLAAEPDAPADFTNFSITTGKGARYRGGVTASSGTSQRAVHSAVIDRVGALGSSGVLSLAKPVRLEVRHWKCPWPQEADLLAVDEETVVLGVEVDTEGVVKTAAIVSDPGYGFGAAALRCARQNRFLPATNELGQPISAKSPPIRVRFSRPR